MGELGHLLDLAQQRRESLVQKLAAENTDCRRLFHGTVEGRSGLTVDKYGPLVLAQTFHEPLSDLELSALVDRFGEWLVYNHRGELETRFQFHTPEPQAMEPVWASEFGLNYSIQARHKGLDPHLFLDLRVGRRWVLENASDQQVLNLFAYSCGLGQAAVAAGATEVWNVDFSGAALRVGQLNLRHNGLPESRVRFIKEDIFPVLWQLSGIGVKGKRARRGFTKFSQREFDLVLLDPPAFAKGPFHTVDLVNDYQSLFKPALLCLKPGGRILATNNLASVSRDTFEAVLTRCAEKAGRPLQELAWLTPEEDFPSFDGQHPLKIAVARITE